MHFQHGNRLNWKRDFLSLDDQTGNISSIRLNLLQRILRITLGSLASLIGLNAFYASTILSQKRITPFEHIKDPKVVIKIELLVYALNCQGKILTFKAPLLNPLEHKLEVQEKDLTEQNPVLDVEPIFINEKNFITQDNAIKILGWLDFKDVVRMRQVNTAWHQLTDNIAKSFTKQFVDSCYSEAMRTAIKLAFTPNVYVHGGISIPFRILLKSLVKYDIQLTMREVPICKVMVKMFDIHLKDEILGDIAKTEAEYDLENAKQTAASITDAVYRHQAFFYIAFHIEKNVAKARELALARDDIIGDYSLMQILQLEAETDLPAAQETFRSIRHPHVQNLAKIEFIKKLAQTDISAAQRLSSELDPCYRYKAEMAIARLEPQPNFQPAIATATTIVNRNIPNGRENHEGEEALADIAIIQNKFDQHGAQNTVSLIQSSLQRKRATQEFIKQSAEHDRGIAMRHLLIAVKELKETQKVFFIVHEFKYDLQLILLKQIARKSMWEAKTMAHSFPDLNYRIRALVDLAEFAIKENTVKQAKPNRDAAG